MLCATSYYILLPVLWTSAFMKFEVIEKQSCKMVLKLAESLISVKQC